MTDEPTSGPESIRGARDALRELARPVATDLRRERARAGAIEAANASGRLLLVVPLCALGLAVLSVLAGVQLALPWAAAAALTLLVAAAPALWRLIETYRTTVSDVGALAEIDRELALEDRLSAAREFVDAAQPDGFMLAAIRDAERRIEAARATRPALDAGAPRLDRSLVLWAAAAALVLFAAGRLVRSPATDQLAPEAGGLVASLPAAAEDEPEREPEQPRERAAPEESRVPSTAASQKGEDTASEESEATDAPQRRGRNPRGAGKSAQARTSSGGGSERGQPSNQAQSTKSGDKQKQKYQAQPKAADDRPEKQGDPPRPEEQSGATQGRGSGRGSSKSPTATPWASKDQVVTGQQEEAEEDEEVDDEGDESDARGALQPNLRQRKPPVNRDLQISMGSGPPNEDANGRGGPGGPKKQRGVAQLVLGVTFPDHVAAPPNPGMSKITQERIEPQAQETDVLAAADRGRRSSPMGHLSQRVLTPWMQDLVRTFTMSLREDRGTESTRP